MTSSALLITFTGRGDEKMEDTSFPLKSMTERFAPLVLTTD